MTERIIDLRNKGQGTINSQPHRNTGFLLEWSALEYEKQNRGPYWFLALGTAAAILVIFGIFTRSYFFIALVALAFMVLALYSRREPQKLSFAITGEGVRAGSKFYEFSQLKSFWIFERPDAKELSLETAGAISPFVRIPLGETDPERIREFLKNFLPEVEHKETASDQIARSIGL